MRSLSRMTVLIAAVLLAVPTTPAAAQMSGTRIGKNVDRKADVPALMRIMAECMIKRRQPMVRNWLDTLPGSAEESKLLTSQLGDLGVCLDDSQLVMGGGTELLVTPKTVRYPLALAMARQHLSRNTVAPVVAKDSDPWFLTKLAAVADPSRVDRAQLIFQDFGHCVALADWEGARQMILTDAGSTAEKAALGRLAPVLGPCLDQDAKIKLTPNNLRTALAEPMVHIFLTAGS